MMLINTTGMMPTTRAPFAPVTRSFGAFTPVAI